MKNLFFTVIGLLSLILTTNAQNVQFGVKAGMNISNLSGDADGLDSRTSIQFGLAAEISISEQFSVQPELIYSTQGAEDKEYDEKLKLDYINVPLIAKYYVIKGLSIEAGPQIGFLISAKSEFDGEDEDIKDGLNGIDFGIDLGLGYKLDNGINFGARYNLGLSDIEDEFDDYKVHNSVFQISVGYWF